MAKEILDVAMKSLTVSKNSIEIFNQAGQLSHHQRFRKKTHFSANR